MIQEAEMVRRQVDLTDTISIYYLEEMGISEKKIKDNEKRYFVFEEDRVYKYDDELKYIIDRTKVGEPMFDITNIGVYGSLTTKLSQFVFAMVYDNIEVVMNDKQAEKLYLMFGNKEDDLFFNQLIKEDDPYIKSLF